MASPTLTCTASPTARGPSTRTQIIAMTCVCAGASAFLFAVDPSRHAVYPQCLLYNATGLYCAGCGATRALHALLHGRVLTALHDNVLFIALLPLLIFTLGSYLAKAWRGDTWPAIHIRADRLLGRGIGLFLLIAAFMILRNLPGAPFDWLRPIP
jgi:Protein of unknown function (DUF2752)